MRILYRVAASNSAKDAMRTWFCGSTDMWQIVCGAPSPVSWPAVVRMEARAVCGGLHDQEEQALRQQDPGDLLSAGRRPGRCGQRGGHVQRLGAGHPRVEAAQGRDADGQRAAPARPLLVPVPGQRWRVARRRPRGRGRPARQRTPVVAGKPEISSFMDNHGGMTTMYET